VTAQRQVLAQGEVPAQRQGLAQGEVPAQRQVLAQGEVPSQRQGFAQGEEQSQRSVNFGRCTLIVSVSSGRHSSWEGCASSELSVNLII
jgi:hypothetical protein